MSSTESSEPCAGSAEKMTVAARVAGIPGVLECILEHLPLRDLLLAQRISRTSHDVIQNSTRFQQALFFRPHGPGPITVLGSQYSVMRCETKGQCEAGHGFGMPSSKTGRPCWNCPVTGKEIASVVANPLLPLFPRGSGTHHYLGWDTVELLRSDSLWRRPEASWRNTLVTQPPMFQATVDHLHDHDHTFQAGSEETRVTAGACLNSVLAHEAMIHEMVGADFVRLDLVDTANEALEKMRQGWATLACTDEELQEMRERGVEP